MCDCQSYNAGEAFGGATPERVLQYQKYFPKSERETVCVDDCIADTIETLWAAGVKTLGSCCGHNGKSPIANGNPNVIIEDPSQAKIVSELLSADDRSWWVFFWA